MNIIFLDFDGPMIPVRQWMAVERAGRQDKAAFDPIAVSMINQLLAQAPAQLVISSTWSIVGRPSIETILERNKIDPALLHDDWTSWVPGPARWIQIKAWANKYQPDKWLAFDDAPIVELGEHAIQCTFEDGISADNFNRALRYFGLKEVFVL